MNEPRCPECGYYMLLIVDGRSSTEAELLHRAYSPRSIKRIPVHALWCTRFRA